MQRRKHSVMAVVAIGIVIWAGESRAQTFSMQGLNRVSFSGSATIAKSSSATVVGGMSRFTDFGIEIGGDVVGVFSKGGASGFGFARVSRNFPGESLFVPFVTGGIGAPIGQSGSVLYDAGGGVRRFTADRRSSLDVAGTWRGGHAGGGHLSVRFGLSYYFGNRDGE